MQPQSEIRFVKLYTQMRVPRLLLLFKYTITDPKFKPHIFLVSKGKGKVYHRTGHEDPEGD
jgi:hypothetical protein